MGKQQLQNCPSLSRAACNEAFLQIVRGVIIEGDVIPSEYGILTASTTGLQPIQNNGLAHTHQQLSSLSDAVYCMVYHQVSSPQCMSSYQLGNV